MICKYCGVEHPPDEICNPHYCIARLGEQVERQQAEITRLTAERDSLGHEPK